MNITEHFTQQNLLHNPMYTFLELTKTEKWWSFLCTRTSRQKCTAVARNISRYITPEQNLTL